MRIEAYDAPNTEKEKVLRLRLVQNEKMVELVVVDEYGAEIDNGALLVFHSDGSIGRMDNVDPAFGLELDEYQQIVVS